MTKRTHSRQHEVDTGAIKIKINLCQVNLFFMRKNKQTSQVDVGVGQFSVEPKLLQRRCLIFENI